jgi:hypothetical protein
MIFPIVFYTFIPPIQKRKNQPENLIFQNLKINYYGSKSTTIHGNDKGQKPWRE